MRTRLPVVVLAAAMSLAACSGTGPPPQAGPSAPPASGASAGSPTGPATATAPVVPPAVRASVVPWRLPGPVSREAAMAYGGGLLVAGGLTPGDVTTGRVWRIDPRGGRAHRRPDLAAPVHDVAGGVVAGRPTLLGGGSAASLSDVQQADAAGHWRVVAHLPTPRSDVSAAAVLGGLVVVGGYDGVQSPRAVLRTSDGRRFRTVARLPHGVRYAGVAMLGGRLWVLGGEESGRELREVWRIDLRTGRVSRAARLPHPLGHEAVVAVGGRLLVVGGRTTSSAMTDRMWWYTPATGRWRSAGRLPYPLADAPAVRVGGAAYLLGGETPRFTDRVVRLTWSR